MAVTLNLQEVALAIRAAADTTSVGQPVVDVLSVILPAATVCVEEYAPSAPDAIHNIAAVRLAGWLYDADPTDRQTGDPMDVSGASRLLARYRNHRAGAIGSLSGTTPAPAPSPSAGLPPAPGAGNYILTIQNGGLVWVEFPLPS